MIGLARYDYVKQPGFRVIAMAVVLLVLFSQTLQGANALSSDQTEALNEGAIYFNTEDTTDTCDALGAGSGSINTTSPTTAQVANAKIIIGIAKTDNVGQAGALIGLMVGLDESSLHDEANENVPLSEQSSNKDGDGSNGTSLGVFQQQITDNWSTISDSIDNQAAINQLMTPAYAAEAFFGSTDASASTALQKGLINHTGWQSEDPWVAAQSVQGSGDPTGSNYRAQLSSAQSLLAQYYTSTTALALPVSVATSAATVATNTGDDCSGETSGATQAVIQAGLAEIAKHISYSYGGGGIDGPSGSPAGFDCSSFMQYIFYQGAGITLPRTAQQQYNATVGAGNSVDQSDIQPGDLMFFGSSPSNIGHVNMYIGNGMIIEAPHTGAYLQEVPQYTVAGPDETLQGIGSYPPIGS